MSEATLRQIASIALVLAMVASGCVGLTGQQPSDESPATTDDSDDETEPATTRDEPDTDDTTPNSTDPNSTDTSPANETAEEPPGERTIQHAMGETTIDGWTTRVVALEFNHVENLLALGIQPVGVANPSGYRKWVAAGNLSESVTDVGTRSEPSLEEIAKLEPDLILGVKFRHEDIYDDLSDIAPTLIFDAFPGQDGEEDQYERMKSIFNRTAKATVREETAKTILDEVDATYNESEARLEAADKTEREILITQLFTYQGQPLARTFIDGSIPDRVAEKIGLVNAWKRTECSTGYGFCDVSKEGFADVQHADFFYQAQPDDDPVKDEWQDDPVWNSYEFVKEDRVYALGHDAWMFGGPLVVQRIAERMANHQVG